MDPARHVNKPLPKRFSASQVCGANELRIAALDLDDTLLNREKKVTCRTRDALNAWIASGRRIVFATGRPPRMAREIPDYLHGHPLICYNGAWIEHRESVIYRNPLPAEASRRFMKQIFSMCPNLWVGYESDDEFFMSRESPYKRSGGVAERPATVVDLTRFQGPAYKIILKPSLMRKEELQFAKSHRPAGSTWLNSEMYDLVQIAQEGTCKSTALNWWLKREGLSMKQTLAIGDDSNDAAMVAAAGLGIAMANAVPSVMDSADFVTDDNNSDGVANVLFRVLNDE